MNEKVGGKATTASYETFRNIFRNALYGASLTEAEIKAFNKAAGTLGQKLSPILTQLQIQMKTVKNNLETVRDTNDPNIAHYYLGKPIEEIDNAVAAIDQRLGSLFKGKTTITANSSVVTPEAPAVGSDTPTVDPTFNFNSTMKGTRF